jgi:hypothetical protein
MSNQPFIEALLAVTPEMTEAAENIGDLYRMGRPELWGQVYRAMLQVALANNAALSTPLAQPVAWYRVAKTDAAGKECPHGTYTAKVFEVNPHVVAWGKYKWRPVVDQPIIAVEAPVAADVWSLVRNGDLATVLDGQGRELATLYGKQAEAVVTAHNQCQTAQDTQDEDAARWHAVASAGSELTLRLHNSRPDKRVEVIDAYRATVAEQAAESSPC